VAAPSDCCSNIESIRLGHGHLIPGATAARPDRVERLVAASRIDSALAGHGIAQGELFGNRIQLVHQALRFRALMIAQASW